MMITNVTMWKTGDGNLFDTQDEAIAHAKFEQDVQEFEKFLSHHDIEGRYSDTREIAITILNHYNLEKK